MYTCLPEWPFLGIDDPVVCCEIFRFSTMQESFQDLPGEPSRQEKHPPPLFFTFFPILSIYLSIFLSI